jgi:hypothetical protein
VDNCHIMDGRHIFPSAAADWKCETNYLVYTTFCRRGTF